MLWAEVGRELIEGNNVLRKIHDILQNEIDVPHIAAEDRLADAMIGNIILLVGRKDLFALQVLPFHLIEQVRLTAVSDIVQNRFRGNGALLVFRNFASEVAEKVVPTLAIT